MHNDRPDLWPEAVPMWLTQPPPPRNFEGCWFEPADPARHVFHVVRSDPQPQAGQEPKP